MINKSIFVCFGVSTILVLLLLSPFSNSTPLQTAVGTEGQANIQHMFLTPSSPSIRSLEKNQIDYYEVFITPRDNMLTILKEDSIGQVEIYVSLDHTNKYPSEKQYTYTTKGSNRNWIELDKKDLTKACVTQSVALCSIYVAVVPQGTSMSSYSISLKRNTSKQVGSLLMNLLEDGKGLIQPIPAAGSSVIYYFYTLPFEPSFVTVKAYNERNKAVKYAKRFDRHTDLASIPDMVMPSSSSYDYMCEETILTLPAQDPMLVVLSVSFTYLESDSDSPGNYLIKLDSQIMPIEIGKQYKTAVYPGQYRYFSLDVRETGMYSILVSAQAVDGQELKLVIAPPYADELPTIENSEYEELKLYGSKFSEIIFRNDIVGGPWLEYGTWVIGVYGEYLSEFTLAAVITGQNIIELQGDKVQWVENQYPIYLVYKPETKHEIRLKTKGTNDVLSYYIRQVSKDENFIFNLPNKANYDWSSPADIDREACNECLYIIGIEMVSSHYQYYSYSGFHIVISDRQYEIIDATPGHPITKSLLPETSDTISLIEFSKPDIYISITSEAEKLELYASNDSTISTTNYHWKTEIMCNNQTQIFKLDSRGYIVPGKDYLYLEIKNPTSQNINYTLVILVIDDTLSPDNARFVLDSGATQAFVLYTTREQFIELYIYATTRSYDPNLQDDKLPYNIQMKAYYWAEDASEVLATNVPVFLATSVPVSNMIALQQVFRVNSKKGKFVFLITNHASQQKDIISQVYTSPNKALILDKNSETRLTLKSKQFKTYKVSFTEAGVWYLSGYSCNGASIYLSIQNDSHTQETNVTRFGPDRQFFFKAVVSKGELDKIIKLVLDDNNAMSDYVLTSVFLPGAIPYKYEVNRKNYRSGIRADRNTGVISVDIHPIRFDEYDRFQYDRLQDTVFYEVLARPGTGMNLCGTEENSVKKRSEEFKISAENRVEIKIKVQQQGQWHVIVVAHVKSQGKEIMSLIVGETLEVILQVEREEPIAAETPVKELLNKLSQDL